MTTAVGDVSSKNSLQRNPFGVLGATTRDNRSRLIELADEVALVGDYDEAQKAQAALLNIRTRLAAEMAWLPGVAPRKASSAVASLSGATAREAAADLPPLARANVLAASAQAISDDVTPQEAASVFFHLALAIEDVDLANVLRDINEDRSVAGFPPVRDEDLVMEEFVARKAEYRKCINDILDRLPSKTLVKVVNAVVMKGTIEGSVHAPAFIQEIVASYEFGLRAFIEAETSKIDKLVKRGVDLAAQGESHVIPVIEEIKKVTTNFNEIVGPVQLVAKTNGIDHAATHNLAIAIRKLAILLYNEYDFIDTPARITTFLNNHFGLLDEVADQVSQDMAYLEEAEEGKKKSQAEREEFERAITYSAEIGAMFKDKVSISPSGVSWQNHHVALEKVTRIRWGATRHSINGIPTGTTYMISLGDSASAFTINTRKSEIYENLVDRIWRAIGVRLLVETVAKLRSGDALRFGDAIVRDDGVTLVRRKMFGSNERVDLTWHQVNILSQDGSFFIRSQSDTKVYVGMSYQNDDNIPVLENLIRTFFKTGKARISTLFE